MPLRGLQDKPTALGTPFVLGGGMDTVLQELHYNHEDGARRRAAGSRGRVARSRGRAQQLSETDPDDPSAGTYEWRDPATLAQDENAFDTDEFDSTPHEWKGAGEPEENVMEYEGSTEWPDEPSEGTYQWRDPATLPQEENTFESDEYDSRPHEWKGAGEPEENVFEGADANGAAKKARADKLLALTRIRAKALQEAEQRSAWAEKRQAVELNKASAQKKRLEEKLMKRDRQLASVTKQLLAEKKRVARVEREEEGHIWRRQHSPVNVLKTVYPTIRWKWHKNVEHLPSAIFDNLKVKPVLWHKYRPRKSHVLDFLSTKPAAWKPQRQTYNALQGLPVGAHQWRKQPREVNVLNSLPESVHQWRRYEGEDNVLASLPSEPHAWRPQPEDKNVLNSLRCLLTPKP